MNRLNCLLVAAAVIASVLLSFPLKAQTASPGVQASAPEALFDRNAKPLNVKDIPVLANLEKTGAKLYYLGERSGMHGWFVLQNGQIQMIYVTPDGKTVLAGGMFTSAGENVTGPQITALGNNDKEIADLLSAAAKQQEEIGKTGGDVAGSAFPGQEVSEEKTQPGLAPSVPLSPGERLHQDLQAAASVVLGHNGAAELMIVIDPNCPHCKATWNELREHVFAKKLQVRLVPVSSVLGSDEARVAARLLESASPLEAWDKYVNGEKNALSGKPDPVRSKAILGNRVLAKKWNITATPYLVYRAKDGRVKIVLGKPERMAAVLSDLLP